MKRFAISSVLFKANKFQLGQNRSNLSTIARPLIQQTDKVSNHERQPIRFPVPTENVPIEHDCFRKIDMSFENVKEAYKSKSNWELARAAVVYQLCSIDMFVDNQHKMMSVAEKVFGKTILEKLLRMTFYSHFVAGANVQEIKPVVQRYGKHGVQLILGYSVEDDLSHSHTSEMISDQKPEELSETNQNRAKTVYKIKSQEFGGDDKRNKNVGNFIRCIDSVNELTEGTGFAAVKITALGRPSLLMKISEVLVNDEDSYHFIQDHDQEFRNVVNRLNFIVDHAEKKNVRLIIDAEQTYFQPVINRLALEMMRKFNKCQALVFNTYQAYLKGTLKRAQHDMAMAAREDFHFGCKLVRGAYIEQERVRAIEMNYDDPTCESTEKTSENYARVFEAVLNEAKSRPKGKVSSMLATHNEDSIRMAILKMKENGIGPDERIVCFGQLMGMCDHVSFSLGQAGFNVYKYVPYGPTFEVLPYLIRRAQENRSIFNKAIKERQLLSRELRRRILTGNLF